MPELVDDRIRVSEFGADVNHAIHLERHWRFKLAVNNKPKHAVTLFKRQALRGGDLFHFGLYLGWLMYDLHSGECLGHPVKHLLNLLGVGHGGSHPMLGLGDLHALVERRGAIIPGPATTGVHNGTRGAHYGLY